MGAPRGVRCQAKKTKKFLYFFKKSACNFQTILVDCFLL